MLGRPAHRSAALVATAALLLGACAEDESTTTTTTVAVEAPDAPSPERWADFGNGAANHRSVTGTGVTAGSIASVEEAWRLDGLSGVTGSPAVLDGIAYVGDWAGTVHAVEVGTGAEVWSTDLGDQSISASAAVTDDQVFVGDYGGVLHALDRATGDVQWSERVDPHPLTRIYGAPLPVGDGVLVGISSFDVPTAGDREPFTGGVTMRDAATGAERWTTDTVDGESDGAGVSVWAPVAVDEDAGLVLVPTGNAYEEPISENADGLLALDLETGEVVWGRQFTDDDVYNMTGDQRELGPDSDVGIAPILYEIDGRAVVGVGDKAGDWFTLDLATGEDVWHAKLSLGSRLGGFNASGAYHDGVLYLTPNIGQENEVDPGGSSKVLAVDASDGTVRWEHEQPGLMFSAVTHVDGLMVFGDTTGVLHAFDAASGEEVWRLDAPGPVGGGVTVVGDTLLVGWGFWVFQRPEAPDGGLLALRVPGS